MKNLEKVLVISNLVPYSLTILILNLTIPIFNDPTGFFKLSQNYKAAVILVPGWQKKVNEHHIQHTVTDG